MAIQWTNNLSVGIEKIDAQHKELFNTINNLLDAMSQGKGKEEVGKVFDFLEDYIRGHFTTEEKYMTQFDYPDYSHHVKQHIEFIKKFNDLKTIFKTATAGINVVISTSSLLGDWWRNHINNVDKDLGIFLKPKIYCVGC